MENSILGRAHRTAPHTIGLGIITALLALTIFGANGPAARRVLAAPADTPTPTAGYPAMYELYKPPITTVGQFPGTSNPTLFGPTMCPAFGDPNLPGNPDYLTMGGKYTYRIAIPSDYAYNQLNVELFDPDTGNASSSPSTIWRTNGTSATAPTCTTPYSPSQTQPCLLTTSDSANPWWTVKVDENRSYNGGMCTTPSGYTKSLNTQTLYRLYYYDTNGNQVDLAYYVGKSDYSSQPVLPFSPYTAAQAASEAAATDLKWISPGASASDLLAAFPSGNGVNGVQTIYGSAAEPATTVEPCDQARSLSLTNASGTFPVSGASQCQGDGNFILNLASEVPGLGTDANGARDIYLDIRSLSGESENDYDVWAGPPPTQLPSDVNARNLMISRQLAAGHPNPADSAGVQIYGEKFEAMNSDVAASAVVPLTYLGPEQGGRTVSPRVFDLDANSTPPIIFYLDNVPKSTWAACFADSSSQCVSAGTSLSAYIGPAILPGSTVWNTYPLTIPATISGSSFAGGNLMVSFNVGATDTYVWAINAGPPLPPTLLGPANNGAVTGAPAYSWAASPSSWANRYIFQLDDSIDFSSPIYISAEQSALSITPPAQTPGVYYWRVKAGDSQGEWSFWSNPFKVTVNLATPPAPLLTAPDDHAATDDPTPSFSWASAAGSSTYTIQIDDDPVFGSPNQTYDTASASELSYTATSLADGQYYWRVRGVNTAGPGAWSGVRSVWIYSAAPTMPANLHSFSQTTTSIGLTWDDTNTETGYRVERSDDGLTGWTLVGTPDGNTPTLLDSGLTCAMTYYYHVQAFNNAGDSGFSDPVAVSTVICAPAAPSDLSATASAQTVIDLAWTDNASTETGFKIERSSAGQNNWVLIQTVATDQTAYSDGAVECGTGYDYRVSAANAGGDSSPMTATATTLDCNDGAPSALNTSAPSQVEIDLTWTDNSSDETGFRIERSPAGMSAWAAVGTVAANQTSYANTGLTCGVGYDYRVRAFNGSGATAPSNVVSQTTLGCTPAAPSVLTATSVSQTRIDLTWHDNSNNETGFKIEQSPNGTNNWAAVTTTAANSTSYSVNTLSCGTSYYFRVRAASLAADSANTSVVSATTVVCSPAAPTNVAGNVINQAQINLTWTDNALNETGFRIERSPAGQESWLLIATLGTNVVAYNDTSLACGTAYDFRVSAFNTGGVSGTLVVSGLTTTNCPTPPSNLVATPASTTQINLTWADNSNNETGFMVERSLAGANTWAGVVTTAANTTSYSNINLTCGTAYDYRVTAVSAANNPPHSSVATAATIGCPPTAPSSLLKSNVTQTSVDLSWTDNSNNETGFIVQRQISGGSMTTITTVSANTTAYQDTGLSCGTNYYYQVMAAGTASNSAPTSVATVPTIPCDPGSLAASPTTQTSITLSWIDTSSDESGYKIDRSPAGANTWAQITAQAANATSYANGTLTCNQSFDYRVYSYNASGNSGYATLTASTLPCTPVAPSGVTATPAGQNQIGLTWNDLSSNEDRFDIRRTPTGQNLWTVVGTVPANSTSYTDTSAACGITYDYVIEVRNAGGYADSSPKATSSTTACNPGAPSGLTIGSVTATQVNLTWTDNATGEDGFKVERAVNGIGTDDWTQVGTAPADTPSFADTSATCNTSYIYRVMAYGSGWVTAPSATKTTTTGTCPPATPTNLVATPLTGKVTLSWTDNATNETGYKIERSAVGANTWSVLTTLAANTTTYTISTLCDHIYDYRVYAYNGTVNSGYAIVTGGALPCLPAQPGGVVATAVSPTEIDISWSDNSTDESGSLIEWSGIGSSWSQLATVGANVETYADTGLTCGTQRQYRITAFNAAGNSPTSTPSAVATTPCPPATPTLLSATAISQTQINLSWTDNANNETGFKIDRSPAGQNNWTQLAALSANSHQYSDSSLTCNSSYDYRVYAWNAAGGASAYAGPITGVSFDCTPTAPSGLSAATGSPTRIDLSWTDNSNNETGFIIERSPVGTPSNWVTLATVAANTTTFANTGLPCGSNYVYRVSATNGGGTSLPGAAASASTVVCLPAAPTSLTTTTSSQTRIDLSWVDNATNEAGYRIERSLAGQNNWSEAGSVDVNVTSYQDNGVSCGTGYDYRVLAFNAAGDSSPTTVQTMVSLPCTPAAPTALTLSPVSPTRIDLSWTDNSNNETAFRIERSPAGQNTWALITTGANIHAYSDTGLVCNMGYDYRVSATNSGGTSAPAGPSTTSTPDCIPAAASGLTATAISQTRIDLNWLDHSNNETGFKIERSPAGQNTWMLLTTTAPDTATYSDTGLVCNSSFDYRVTAFNSGGNASPTTIASAGTPLCIPDAPTSLSAQTISQSRIDLSWADNAATEMSFKIERSSAGANTWVQIGTTAANATSYSDTTPVCDDHFDYRVKATGADGDSASTNVANASTAACALPAPDNLQAVIVTPGQISLTWADNSADEDGFHIERSMSVSSGWAGVSVVDPDVVAYSDAGLICNTQYYYRVRASSPAGYSAYSSAVGAHTPACLPVLAAPRLLTKNNTLTNVAAPDLAWLAVANATGYHIQVADDSSFKTVIKDDIVGGQDYYATSLDDGVYYWRVASVRYGIQGKWSAKFRFTIDRTPPPVPVLKSATVSKGVPTLTVLKSVGAVKYEFQVSLDFSNDSLTVTDSLIKTASYRMPTWLAITLTHNTPYYWRVAAVDKAGNVSIWSSVWSFIIP